MSFPKYPKYKESGVRWLGEVPEHWLVAKTARYFKIAMGQTILQEDLVDEGVWPVFSATDGDHYFGRVNEPQVRLGVGDIVIPARGNSIGSVKIVKEPSTTTQTTIYCKNLSQGKLAPSYVFHFLRGCRNNLFFFTQTAIPQITVSEVGSNPILIPPIHEQTAIASFLDAETGKIDALIAEQRRLIDSLEEKRQAVISHAVTKGLNPNAPMKPSGIQWLGDVPKHWDVVALKRLVARPIIDGPHVSPQKYDEGVPFISAESIGKGFIDFDKKWGYISPEDHKLYSQRYKPERGDILLVKLGATTGVPAIVETDTDFNIWVPLAAIRLKKHIQPRFIFHVLRSHNMRVAYELNWTYGTQQTLGLGTISNLRMPVPPDDERQQIVDYLDATLPGFDALEAEAERSVELLQERRTALISAAVTGKIDVRQSVPKEEAA